MNALGLFSFLPVVLAAPALHNIGQEVLGTTLATKHSAPIKSWQNFFHVVNITIGTPPQRFNVSLDLEEAGFTVPSTECTYCRGDGFHHLYNASASSTFEDDGSGSTVEWLGDRFTGSLARDTVRINDVEIDNQTFLAWDKRVAFAWPAMSRGFDGALGIGPPWSNGQHRGFNITYPPYLSLLQSADALEKDVFSLDFPRGLDDEGEFTLGGTNPDRFIGEIRKVKLLNESDLSEEFQSTWNVPISSIRLNTSHPIRVDIPNGHARLSSSPILIIPQTFADTIIEVIGGITYYPYMYHIPCSRRAYLPELTFTIGGYEFTVSAFDYTWELPQPYGFEPVCIAFIVGNEDALMPKESVTLGTPFLRGFYGVWDFGNREIGFADLKR